MAYFSIPKAGQLIEILLDGSAVDTSGNALSVTATNVTYETSPVGYKKQRGSFNGSSSSVVAGNVTLGSNFTISCKVKRNNSSDQSYFTFGSYPTGGPLLFYSVGTLYYRGSGSTGDLTYGSFPTGESLVVVKQVGTTATIYVNGVQVSQGTVNSGAGTWSTNLGTLYPLGIYYLNGSVDVTVWNYALTDSELLALWNEFNRKLAGGSDFGAYIPAPTAQFEADGSNTFVDVAAQGAVTRTAGAAASDDFGITRAISTPNQSWTSVSGDSFVYWNNSGWKLEKNQAAVTATGIDTSNTVRAVLYYPTGVISTDQQTYLENCFKRNYPYAFRRSIPQNLITKAKFYAPDGRYNIAQPGYDLSPVGSPTTVRAQQNTCASTAATGDYLANAADITGCDIAAGNAYTLACWLKSSDTTGVAYYLFAGDATTPLNLSILLLSGVIQVDWSRANVADDLTSTGLAPDGKWHHVAATFSGGVTKVYLDGYLKATGSYTDTNGTGSPSITGISVARGFDSSTQVSDPFVTNSALTHEEIQRLRLSTYRN